MKAASTNNNWDVSSGWEPPDKSWDNFNETTDNWNTSYTPSTASGKRLKKINFYMKLSWTIL